MEYSGLTENIQLKEEIKNLYPIYKELIELRGDSVQSINLSDFLNEYY